MKTIWKFVIRDHDVNRFSVHMPKDAEVLTFDMQHGTLCVWTIVETDNPVVQRHFAMVGTGKDATDLNKGSYVKTLQFMHGNLVFHFFDLGEES